VSVRVCFSLVVQLTPISKGSWSGDFRWASKSRNFRNHFSTNLGALVLKYGQYLTENFPSVFPFRMDCVIHFLQLIPRVMVSGLIYRYSWNVFHQKERGFARNINIAMRCGRIHELRGDFSKNIMLFWLPTSCKLLSFEKIKFFYLIVLHCWTSNLKIFQSFLYVFFFTELWTRDFYFCKISAIFYPGRIVYVGSLMNTQCSESKMYYT